MYLLQENDKALSLHTRTACRSRPCWLHSPRGAERPRPEAVSHSFCITAPPSMRSWSVLPPFHAPEAYAHVSGPCGAARFLAEMRRYRTLCVLLRLPKKSFGPPCENAFPGAVLLPAPESLFYMLSTGLRHSFNNILYISALQTTMSCGIVHHAAQEAVVATADMHQRRRLSHCTQKTATRKAGGQGAGDNHQGERK